MCRLALVPVHAKVILLGVLGGADVLGFSGPVLGPRVVSIFVTILSVYREQFALRSRDIA